MSTNIQDTKENSLSGLSTEDRSLSDKTKIEEISRLEFDTPADLSLTDRKKINWKINSDKPFFERIGEQYINNPLSGTQYDVSMQNNFNAIDEHREVKKKNEEYDREWQAKLDEINEEEIDVEELSDFADHLEEVSPYFRRYKDSYINMDNKNLELVKNMYEEYIRHGIKDVYSNPEGDKTDADVFNEADIFLDGVMRDMAAHNQPLIAKYGNAAAGIANSAASAVAGFLGAMSYAIAPWGDDVKSFEELKESGELPPGVSWGQYYINRIMDNPMSRWGEGVTRTGYWDSDKREEAEALYGEAANKFGILETFAEQEKVFDANLIPKAIQSHGFTLATMAISLGLSSAVGAAAKGARAVSYVNKAKKATSTIEKIKDARKAIETSRKISNITNRYIIPSVTATGEAAIEGLGTKLNILKTGEQMADSMYGGITNDYNEAVSNLAWELKLEAMSKGYDLSDEDAVMRAKEYYSDIATDIDSKYNEIMNHVEAVAMQQGTNVFILNEAINGVIASTFKAGLQAPSVQKAITKGKTLLSPNPIKISKNGKVSITKTPIRNIYGYIKEPLGESLEETLQSLASGTTEGVAEFSISEFIKNKYDGDATYVAGDHVADEWTEAMKALKASAISKETAESALLGAIGSIIGTPSMRRSDYQKAYIDADGKQRTKFSLGRREGESSFEYFQRISPWRSGLSYSIQEQKDKRNRLKEDVELIEDWLSKKENIDKFNNASSIVSWYKQMDEKASEGDEFGFRNTVLGKTINDVFILDKIKHTEYYKDLVSYMQTLSEAKYNPNDTKIAEAVATIRQDNSISEDFNNLSDEEVFNRLKENARKYLDTIESVKEESDKIDELIGYVDDDTKQSLIYEKLLSDDLERRRKTILSEVTPQLGKVTNSINTTSGFSDEQRRAYVLQESTKKVKESNKKLEDTISTLSSEVKRLEDKKKSRRGFSQEDAKKLEENKRKLKRAKNTLKEINKELNKLNVEFSDKNTILSETEILNLPSGLRTYILDPKHLEEYSKEQQDVIKNIQASLGPSTFSKVIDLGRIDNSIRKKNLNYINILHNHRDYTKAVSKAKEEASRLAVKHDIDRLNSMSEEEYSKYVEELNTISTRDYYTQYLYSKYLDKNNNNYKKYSEQNNMFLTLSKRVSNDLKNNVISSTKARYLSYTLDYIKERGADITDISNFVFPILSEQDDAGEFKLLEYFKSRELQLDEKNRVNVPIEIGSAIENFNQLVSRVNSSIKEATEIEEKTKENPTPKEVTASSIVIGREGKEEVKEFSDEEIEEEFGYLRDQFHAEDSDYSPTENTDVDVNKLTESFKKELTNLGMAKNTVDKLVSDLESSIATSKNVTSGIESFKKKALGKHIRIALERAKLVVGSVEKEHEDSNINSQEQIGNTSVNHISSVNLDNIPENSTLGSFVKEHNIDAYLRANEQTLTKENVPIYFAAIGSVSISYKEQKEKDEENYSEVQDTTIAILVKDDNGKLVIDGIHYQPIGIVPRTNNRVNKNKSKNTNESLANLRMSIIRGKNDRIVDRLTKDNVILLPVEGTLNNIVKSNSISIKSRFESAAEFVSKVGTEKLVSQDDSDDESRTFLVVDTASPGNPKHTMSVIIKPISETMGTKTSKVGNVREVPIIELIKEAIDKNNTWDLSQANSRLTNFFKNTNSAIKKLLEYHISGRQSGKENSTKNAFNFISKDSIYFGDVSTTISYNESLKQYIINFNTRDSIPDLIISEQDLAVLANTTEEAKEKASYRLSNKVALQLLNNIVFDDNGGIRYNSDGYPVAKWQVFTSNANAAAEVENSPNPDIKSDDAKKANEDFKNIYHDNILEISSRQSLEFSVTTSTDNSDQAEVISPVIKKDDGLDVVRVNGTTVTVDPEVGILGDQPKEIEDPKVSTEDSYEDPLGALGSGTTDNLMSLMGFSNDIDSDFTPDEVKENMNKCNGE